MTLKSDAIPGSGTSLAGIIDRDIAYDKLGLPFIPAKRIKGVLKESAEDLRLKNIEEIFGKKYNDKGVELRISNGHLEHNEDYKELLNAKEVNTFLPKQAVLDFFTYTRSQTTIEDGVAKENSLRVSRVLKKGLGFAFEIQCEDKHKSDLAKICKVTRSFGSSRTRGFGEIELKLVESESSNDSVHKIEFDPQSEATTKLKLTVENIQQLLLSSTPGKSQVSDDYINGSAVLGALAWNYLQNNSDDERFNELFLSGKVSFGNLYPIKRNDKNKRPYFPSPLSIKKVKTVKSNKYNSEYFDHSNLEDEKILEDVIFKGGFPSYSSLSLQNKIGVVKNVEAHHRRDENRHIAKSTKKGSGNFFQFEVIEQGQAFSGEITGPEKLLSKLQNSLPENGEIWFGKSKTGQYGKCSISWEKSDYYGDNLEWDADESMKFIFRSDMILLNENGFATGDVNLFVSQLENKLEIGRDSLKLTKCFSKTVNTGGFMGVWRLPRIQKTGISAGAVIDLKNISGKLIEADNIESMVFGDRTEDGFGRIAAYKKAKEGRNEPDYDETIKMRLKEIKDSVNKLVQYQLVNIINRELQSKAIEKAGTQANNSFIGKIIAFLNDSDSFKKFEIKLAELKSDKQKKNLSKLKEGLLLKGGAVDFQANMVSQSLDKVPHIITDMLNGDLNYFKFYKHYTLAFLTQVKYNNRKGGK